MYDIDDIRDSTYNMSRYSISVEPHRPLLVYTDITDLKLSDKKKRHNHFSIQSGREHLVSQNKI